MDNKILYCLILLIYFGCDSRRYNYQYVEKSGLSMVDDNQFEYKNKVSKKNDFFSSSDVMILIERREELSRNYYFLFWNDGKCYLSSGRSINSTYEELCNDNSGYKGCYYYSGDTLYTEIITGSMEHLFRDYVLNGDTLEYVSFKKKPRYRRKAIRQKLDSEDIKNGMMTREFPDSTICMKLRQSFW